SLGPPPLSARTGSASYGAMTGPIAAPFSFLMLQKARRKSTMWRPCRGAKHAPPTRSAWRVSGFCRLRRQRRLEGFHLRLEYRPFFCLVLEGAQIAHNAGGAQGLARRAGIASVQNQPVMGVQAIGVRYDILQRRLHRQNVFS